VCPTSFFDEINHWKEAKEISTNNMVIKKIRDKTKRMDRGNGMSHLTFLLEFSEFLAILALK